MPESDASETHKLWIDQIEQHGVNVSAWEQDFCESIKARLERGQHLTERQAETLEEIYAKRTG